MYKFLKILLKKEIGSFISFIIVFSLFSIFEFIIWNLFFSIININSLQNEEIIINLMTTIMVMILLMTILFINYFFTDTRKKEFSLILLSGRKTKDILYFLLLQYGGILLVSGTFAVLVGSLLLKLISIYISNVLNIILQYEILKSLGMFVLMNIIKFLYIMLINFGFFARLETKIVKLMSAKTPRLQTLYIDSIKQKNMQKDTWIVRHLKPIKLIVNLLIIIIIFMSIKNIFDVEDMNKKIFGFLMATSGLVMFINITVPYIFEIFHKLIFLKSPVLLVAYSNIIYMTKSLTFIINLSSILIPIIFSIFSFFIFGSLTKLYIILCVSIILIMLFICLIFKFSLLINNKRLEVRTLNIIGFNERKLKVVKIVEINLFYFLAVIMPMLVSFILLYSGIRNGIVETSFAKLMVMEYLICVLVTYAIINFLYKIIYERRIKK